MPPHLRIRRLTVAALGLLILAAPAAAATPDVAWTSTFGGPGADHGWAAAPSADGGYVVAGTTDPAGTGVEDAYLVKIDAFGRKVWERTFGGAAKDAARAVLPLRDGGFILAGDTGVPPTAFDLLVIRTAADGEPLWQTIITRAGRDEGRGICATTDGGFVVCGDAQSTTAGSQFHLVKLDADGGVVWQRTYGGGDDHAYAIAETSDRGLVFCGYSGEGSIFAEFDARVFKVNAGGGPVWQRTFSASVDDRAHALRVLPGGDIAVAGIAASRSALWRLDAGGSPRWNRTYAAAAGQAFALDVSPHGGFYLAGYAWAYDNGAYQITLQETDAAGDVLSSQLIAGAGWEFGRGIALSPAGDLLVVGSTNSEGAGSYDLFAVGLDIGAISAVDDLPGPQGDTLAATPNPFNPRLHVTFTTARDGAARLSVYDLRGRHVATLHDGPVSAGEHTTAWDGRDRQGRALPTGTYLVRLLTANGATAHKVSLVR